jgi:hypothetical protein
MWIPGAGLTSYFGPRADRCWWPRLFADWFVQVEGRETLRALRWDSLNDGIGGSGGDDPT